MIVGVAIASILAFLFVFWASKVVSAATKAIHTAAGAMQVLSNDHLDDEAKEKATRKAAIDLLGSVVSIATRCAVSVIAAVIPIYAADMLGLSKAEDIFSFLMRWDVIIVSSVVIVLLHFAGRRFWQGK